MSNITFEDLNEQQQEAFTAAIEAMDKTGNDGPRHLTINGPAGTGKTTLTKFLIDHLIKTGKMGVQLAAPTHQARKILSNLSGMQANTIHSLLKINPTNYEDSTTFEQSDIPDLSECDVLICDEVSMYDRKLFQILMSSIPRTCTIIGLGDIAQIRPVAPGSTVSELSAFFFNEHFKQISLTKVMRSNAPIIEVATEIRNGGWIREQLVDGQGVHCLTRDNGGSVAAFLGKYFEIVKDADALFDYRMLAYTNKSVNDLNRIIRQRLYETKAPFIKHEVVVMQEPLVMTHTFDGKKFTEIVYNNGEQIRINECKETTATLRLKDGPDQVIIKVWELHTTSVDDPEISATIRVIDDEQELTKFQYYLSRTADNFKSMRDRRPDWKQWWALKSKFHKVKALPVSTIHKSQGSTVDSAFVYTPCIHRADAELAKQLLYVATTRARNNVYYI